MVRVELAAGHIVEEEEGAGTLYEHVVDAVVDDVGPDAPVTAEAGGELHLGAHSVGAGNQDGIVHRLDRGTAEGAAEAAHTAQHGWAMGAFHGRLHLGDGASAFVDVDAGRGVGLQLGTYCPPTDVAAHLHAGEVDPLHAGVGVGAGLGEVKADAGDGQHPPPGDILAVGTGEEHE